MTTICLSAFLALANGVTCPEPVPLDARPVLVTYYNVNECYDELGNTIITINCDSDPGHFADMTAVSEASYGTTAACIPQWLGLTLTVIGLGTFTCHDTGGGIVVGYDEYYGVDVIRVDLLMHSEIECNYCLWGEWYVD